MPNGRQCCICTAPLKGIGCRADPFKGGMCCDDCKDRYVEPVRKIFGEAVTVNMLNVLRSLAKESRHIRESRAISDAMRDAVNGAAEDPDS